MNKKIRLDLIQIDDDPDLCSCWRMEADAQGKRIKTYITPEDFFKEAHMFDLATLICIDAKLGDGVRGEHVAKEIYDIGFRTIYLSTGYSADSFGQFSWITKIIGKEPPF